MSPASTIVHNKSTGKFGEGGMDMAYCAAGIKKVKTYRSQPHPGPHSADPRVGR